MNNRILEEYFQGNSSEAYKVMGAHFSDEYEHEGVRFTVYAPNAARVILIGTFNQWNGYDMQRLACGTWTIFVQGICELAMYKYRIITKSGETYDRMDPFAFFSELRPNTASIVYSLEGFRWTDDSWMNTRNKNYNKAMSIYEVDAGSWKVKELNEQDSQFYSYTELSEFLIPYIKDLGYTHIELLPLTEYPFDGSWGYQVAGYYSATSRYGTPRELMQFINCCHEENIGVIMDFVPAHFVADSYALQQYDGDFLYESNDESQRYSEWGTVLFDFTKPHVVSFLKSAINFWISYYHFDGVRYDAVSRLLYHQGREDCGINEAGIWFLKTTNYTLQSKHPDVMLIAEDSSNYLKVTAPVVYGGLGFDYKWDLGWMNDTLSYLALPASQRSINHKKITFSMDYFYQDIYLLPFSHDEVVHGKKTIIDKISGTYEEKFCQLRSLYLYMFTHPGKKLNFMGNELAEFREWDETKELGWNLMDYEKHKEFSYFFSTLQKLYQEQPALYQEDYHPQGFVWLDTYDDAQCLYAYRRSNLKENELYIVINFSAHSLQHYYLQVDRAGRYEELINTNALKFGGNGRQNGKMQSVFHEGKHAVEIRLAPYSSCMICYTDEEKS